MQRCTGLLLDPHAGENWRILAAVFVSHTPREPYQVAQPILGYGIATHEAHDLSRCPDCRFHRCDGRFLGAGACLDRDTREAIRQALPIKNTHALRKRYMDNPLQFGSFSSLSK